MEDNDIVIVAAKRTPMGGLLGSLSALSAPELQAVAHQAALVQAGISAAEIEEVISSSFFRINKELKDRFWSGWCLQS